MTQDTPKDETAASEPEESTLPAVESAEKQSLRALLNLGEVMSKSGYFPDVKTNSAAVVKIMLGRELGFSPIAAMSGVHIIEGVPTLHARMQAALLRKHPRYDYRITEHTDILCIIEFIGIDEEGERSVLGESAYSIEDARTAELVKPRGNWVKFPRNMLFARAMTNGIGWFAPDAVSMPLYDPTEIDPDIEITATGQPVVDGEPAKQEEAIEGEFRDVPDSDPQGNGDEAPAEEDAAGTSDAAAMTVGELQTWAETYASGRSIAYSREKLLSALGVETIAGISPQFDGPNWPDNAQQRWRARIERLGGDSPAAAKLAEAAAVSAHGDAIVGRTDGDADESSREGRRGTAEVPGAPPANAG